MWPQNSVIDKRQARVIIYRPRTWRILECLTDDSDHRPVHCAQASSPAAPAAFTAGLRSLRSGRSGMLRHVGIVASLGPDQISAACVDLGLGLAVRGLETVIQ